MVSAPEMMQIPGLGLLRTAATGFQAIHCRSCAGAPAAQTAGFVHAAFIFAMTMIYMVYGSIPGIENITCSTNP
jgi:hypothetical protein